jgi:glycosyltransferase involved in cell wall biosynthesis
MNEKIDIILVTCNRVKILGETLDGLFDRIKIPFRLIIIDNVSTDGTAEYLDLLQVLVDREIEIIHNTTSINLSEMMTQGLQLVKSELFITTFDDILIPDLEIDVLQQLIEMINKRQDLGGICLRTAQMKRKFPDDEVLIVDRACPSYFRIQRKNDIIKAGGFGIGRWEDSNFINVCKKVDKKCAIATNLWAKDLGASPDRGYSQEFREKLKKEGGKFAWGANDRPQYIDPNTKLDEKTNKPIK